MTVLIIIMVISVYIYSYRIKKNNENKNKYDTFNFTSVEDSIEKFGEKLRSDLFMSDENGKTYIESENWK